MPEAGYLPIPKKLASKGLKDMIRVSDARMSGTAFGTIVLHVTPDAASGGPLSLVRSGDRIKLSVKERRIDLLVDDAELKKRGASFKGKPPVPPRGYAKLYAEQILGADQGCDFAFLKPHEPFTGAYP
jgi:dihydroxy-acid dehydratase